MYSTGHNTFFSILKPLFRFPTVISLVVLISTLALTATSCTAPTSSTRAIDPGFTLPRAGRSDHPAIDRKILARGDHAYAPFEFVDGSGNNSGFNIDLLLRVGAIMDLDIHIELGPWDEVRAQLERGEIDMLPGMYKTPERELLVDFSIPHFISSYGIFAGHNSRIRGVEDLATSRVAVQMGDVGHDYLVEQNLAGELVIFNTWEDIFVAVLNGEADCAVASMIQGIRLLQEKRYASLRQIGPPLIQQRYCMAVSKGDAELLAVLNEGLSILKATGEYDLIYEKWFGLYEDEFIRSQRLYRILMMALTAALVLGLVVVTWSAALRRQVQVKTLALTRELALNEETRGKLAQALGEAEQSRLDAEGARLEAEEANRTKSVFLASISHELRTPLHGVIGISHLLERSPLNEDQQHLLGMLAGAASQLERLITDLLDLTRSATGTLSLNPVAFKLGELAEWMEEPLRRQAEARSLALSISISEPELSLFADKERLAQIVVNLASNGIKFTEKGEVAVSIGLKTEQLCIEVNDTGFGIPETERERVFEAFYQLDNGPTGTLHSGLGLGLSIIRLLVQLMGGSIHLSDRPGGGTNFTVLLPFTTPPAEVEEGTRLPQKAAEGKLHHTENRGGKTVLIVEDEAINRLYIQRILREQGMKTTGVGDGEAAVAAAGRERFDLILMDMGLPVMSGLDATRAIRQEEASSGTQRSPIAALTANAYPQDREECTKAGMDGFISKPFEEKAFWQVIDRLLAPPENPVPKPSTDTAVSPSEDQD
jgi:signal transduction histidine kinase/CheY-like chemotaxis protein